MPDNIKLLGLIGRPLSHSFSQSYFTRKFSELGLTDYRYHLYELPSIDSFEPLVRDTPGLIGLNVTIPYKQEVIPFLDELSDEALAIGAVNVIKISSGRLIGYNSDYYGFEASLLNWLPKKWRGQALILGTGGASLAVKAVLNAHNIPFRLVSRQLGPDQVTYNQARELDLVRQHKLIINTTPVGMHPDTDRAPDIEYSRIGKDHYLYDLIYNPENTRFMQKGLEMGAKVVNGLEMLRLQAERSWDIWTGQTAEGKG